VGKELQSDDTDEDGDVLTPLGSKRAIDWSNATTIKLGDPWMPAPPLYVPPKTREELVQEMLDAIDANGKYSDQQQQAQWIDRVVSAREELR